MEYNFWSQEQKLNISLVLCHSRIGVCVCDTFKIYNYLVTHVNFFYCHLFDSVNVEHCKMKQKTRLVMLHLTEIYVTYTILNLSHTDTNIWHLFSYVTTLTSICYEFPFPLTWLTVSFVTFYNALHWQKKNSLRASLEIFILTSSVAARAKARDAITHFYNCYFIRKAPAK